MNSFRKLQLRDARFARMWSGTAAAALSVFLLAPIGASGAKYNFTNIYTFGPPPDGTDPSPGFVRDTAGNVYGCTYLGGKSGDGTVYELSPPGDGQTKWKETILYNFGSVAQYPIAQIGIDAGGSLYVTTYFGGDYGGGILLKLSPPAPGQNNWTSSVLHNFGGTGDVGTPLGVIVGQKSGTVYGEAKYGGADGEGGVFRVLQRPNGTQESVLYSFTTEDGANYYGTLALGRGRSLYGTSPNGGNGGLGLVYELSPPTIDGQPWLHTVIHNFTGGTGDGSYPQQGVAEDRYTGIVYGATTAGGANGLGVMFSLTPPQPGSTNWVETILHNFTDQHGYLGYPVDSLTVAYARDRRAKLPTIWGTSSTSPDGHEPSKDVTFSLSPHADGGTTEWNLKVQHKFDIKVNGWARGDLLEYDNDTIIGLTRGDEQSLFGTVYMLTRAP